MSDTPSEYIQIYEVWCAKEMFAYYIRDGKKVILKHETYEKCPLTELKGKEELWRAPRP